MRSCKQMYRCPMILILRMYCNQTRYILCIIEFKFVILNKKMLVDWLMSLRFSKIPNYLAFDFLRFNMLSVILHI